MHDFRTHPFAIRIIESPTLTISAVDWSGCRSPSRAARRARLGYRQNIRHFTAPHPGLVSMGGALYVHPETSARLRAITREVERTVSGELSAIVERLQGSQASRHEDGSSESEVRGS